MATVSTVTQDHKEQEKEPRLSPQYLLSGDIVVGLIGYAGAGCTDVYTRLKTFLKEKNYDVKNIKMSECIVGCLKHPPDPIDNTDGAKRLERAEKLQNAGDELRRLHGADTVASLAIRKIKELRNIKQKSKVAIIVDSFKHPAEVELMRTVYEQSFLLIGVYCDQESRLGRLENKYYQAEPDKIVEFMDRDEKDQSNNEGQQVKKGFHLSDFFLDNSATITSGQVRKYDQDLQRFVEIMEGGSLIRPSAAESAMYAAYSAAQRSSCLSRQVGAAVTNENGEVISTGTNEVPAYGGGVYHDGHRNEDSRCFRWKWWEKLSETVPKHLQVPLCHNTRKKNELKEEISRWMKMNLPDKMADFIFSEAEDEGLNLSPDDREKFLDKASKFFEELHEAKEENNFLLNGIPGIGDLIEFSRSIHAEMDAVLSAARLGVPLHNGSLYVTTYPCHNCARHLVAAGVKEVRFLEPYEKSLATLLHSDSIANEDKSAKFMSIRPYTGVGPRVYDQYFLKRGELKDSLTGKAINPDVESARIGVRIFDLDKVEELAIKKIPEIIEV
ncbi:MAG: hypothetical protein F4233_02725 [Rhodospirillaceae bacterium]|nr:hypothetical protein [Rhodospirillaceae bacterium]